MRSSGSTTSTTTTIRAQVGAARTCSSASARFRFDKLDIADRGGDAEALRRREFRRVVHLAAQAGVRHSIENPHVYVQSNVTGFLHVLEGCRQQGVEHLVYASTSSVYGANTSMPFSEQQNVDHPLTLYAATKKANELMAHSYSSLYGLPTTGLRFFTVYGPWGRPDMALFLFTQTFSRASRSTCSTRAIISAISPMSTTSSTAWSRRSTTSPTPDPRLEQRDAPDPSTSSAPVQDLQHRQSAAGDAAALYRSARAVPGAQGPEESSARCSRAMCRTPGPTSSALARDVGYRPSTQIEEGVKRFVDWYLEYYGVSSRIDGRLAAIDTL